jgi:hypothetical protein
LIAIELATKCDRLAWQLENSVMVAVKVNAPNYQQVIYSMPGMEHMAIPDGLSCHNQVANTPGQR